MATPPMAEWENAHADERQASQDHEKAQDPAQQAYQDRGQEGALHEGKFEHEAIGP